MVVLSTMCRYGMVVVDEVGNSSECCPRSVALYNLLKLRLKEAVRWAMLNWMMCRRRGELVVVLGAGEGEEEAR